MIVWPNVSRRSAMSIVPTAMILFTVIKITDLITHLVNIGQVASRNALIKSLVAVIGAFSGLALAANATITKNFDLHTILPVAQGSVLKSLNASSVVLAALMLGLGSGTLVDFRKALDNTDSAQQPTILNGN